MVRSGLFRLRLQEVLSCGLLRMKKDKYLSNPVSGSEDFNNWICDIVLPFRFYFFYGNKCMKLCMVIEIMLL